jgi:hypothetical protein
MAIPNLVGKGIWKAHGAYPLQVIAFIIANRKFGWIAFFAREDAILTVNQAISLAFIPLRVVAWQTPPALAPIPRLYHAVDVIFLACAAVTSITVVSSGNSSR